MNGMVREGKTGAWCNLSRVGVVLCLMVISKIAAGALILTDLSNGYRDCSWVDQGDGTSMIYVTIDYKTAGGHVGPWNFISRGILISAYDKNGTVGPSVILVDKSNVSMNSAVSTMSYTPSNRLYSMYYGSNWYIANPFAANVAIRINNAAVANWPAIAVRAGNYTSGDDYGEITGAAYIARGDYYGSCRVITDPSTPPPMPITITMSAPDWDLGELQEGDSTKTFANSSEQLCFSYSGASTSGKKFIINAGSANGISGNRYRLKNVKDSTQIVPYSITLDSGVSTLKLPNAVNKEISFNSSGRTCFVPTFATSVDPTLKGGDYSDILTFTVVTKS